MKTWAMLPASTIQVTPVLEQKHPQKTLVSCFNTFWSWKENGLPQGLIIVNQIKAGKKTCQLLASDSPQEQGRE